MAAIIHAAYHDGRSARTHAVELQPAGPGKVCVAGDGIERLDDYDTLRVSTRLGASPRYVYFSDGARCETLDNDGVDAMVAAMGARARPWLHVLESRLGLALAALLLTVAGIWSAVQLGVPWAARQVAMSLPPEVSQTLGAQAMETLDGHVFEPSALTLAEHRRVQAIFERVRASTGGSQRLTLRLRAADGLGANAFALPNDTIVVTDDMVALARNDEELLAVIAHEAGHVHHRHGLRQLLQSTATAVLIAALLGDISSISGLSAALPTFLVDQSYSRGFEREADRFAIEVLQREQIPRERFAAVLERLGADRPDAAGWLGYLSSHPATAERARAARDEP